MFFSTMLSEQTLLTRSGRVWRRNRKKQQFSSRLHRLVEILGLNWSAFYKLQKRGIIDPHDALVNGKPAWLSERIVEIESRIAEL